MLGLTGMCHYARFNFKYCSESMKYFYRSFIWYMKKKVLKTSHLKDFNLSNLQLFQRSPMKRKENRWSFTDKAINWMTSDLKINSNTF
jgi:hypothetical protein